MPAWKRCWNASTTVASARQTRILLRRHLECLNGLPVLPCLLVEEHTWLRRLYGRMPGSAPPEPVPALLDTVPNLAPQRGYLLQIRRVHLPVPGDRTALLLGYIP